jgi:hypothetical protein
LQGCKIEGISQISQTSTFLYKITAKVCRATKLRVPRSSLKMASNRQLVNKDHRELVDLASGGSFLGVGPTSVQTIEPKPNIPDESSFGGLPPEIRNRIYWYASVHSAPIHLAAAFDKQRTKWHDDAAASKLFKSGVPPIAQTNKQFRRECLGVYYGMNSFVFMFNASTEFSEEGSMFCLSEIILIIRQALHAAKSAQVHVQAETGATRDVYL